MSDHLLADWRQHALTLETEVNKVVVGQSEPVRLITTAIFARGHVLLEGDVGVGTISASVHFQNSRHSTHPSYP